MTHIVPNTTSIDRQFQTKADCFRSAAAYLTSKLRRAEKDMHQTGIADAAQVGGYLFSSVVLYALAAECALKALSAKSTSNSYLRSHDLLELYEYLPQGVKELVESIARKSVGPSIVETLNRTSRVDFV